MKTIFIIIESVNEEQQDILYEFLLEKQGFNDTIKDIDLPGTMLIKETNESKTEAFAPIENFIFENNLKEINVFIGEVSGFHHWIY